MAEKKKVVVVGGGVAGSKIALDLEGFADVTLIDPKNYFELPYPQPRSVVEPSFADRALILYEDFLRSTIRVESTAEDVTAEEVITASGESIPYDYLVIATGTTHTGPATREARLQQFREEYKKVADATSVLIIGGGPVGVELAAEIITDFPQKKVTLVTGGSHLLEFLGASTGGKAEAWLKKKGVEVILNEYVHVDDSNSPPGLETKSHGALNVDAHFITIGKKVASRWLGASKYLKNALTKDGRVKMEPTTQVTGFANVFAAGDITDFKEIKEGRMAAMHAGVVVGNIKKLIKIPNDTKLQVYKPEEKPKTIVSLGRVDGLLHLPFFSWLGWLPGTLKSQDFYISKCRVELGLKAK